MFICYYIIIKKPKYFSEKVLNTSRNTIPVSRLHSPDFSNINIIHPSLSCSYEYTRNYANKLREMEEDFENYWQEEPEEDSLKYEDFGMFISVLKQYYRFCQVVFISTNVVLIQFHVTLLLSLSSSRTTKF